jgi:hypothetical protein
MKIRNQINLAILSSLGLIGMAVAADQAQVATLVRIDGAAVASQDANYVPAREGMTLKEGDRLMVLEGGSAILAFADGCQFELGEMAMLAVQGVSTCAANGGGVYKVDPKSGIADGAVPQPQLAAIGNKKARSKAQCDAAAKNANPKDDCDCEERRNNSDKDDDCPPVAVDRWWGRRCGGYRNGWNCWGNNGRHPGYGCRGYAADSWHSRCCWRCCGRVRRK